MKLTYYLDWWPGMENWKPCNPYVTADPGVKSEGVVRLSFDVEIPDHLIGMSHKVDEKIEASEVSASEDQT